MSLLYKAGAILYRAGFLVSAAAQACIDACCGNWYCCWQDAEKSYSECQNSPCPTGMQRSGPYADEIECQASCDVPPEWYCCWDTPEPRTSGATSTCQEGPCQEGYFRSGPYSSEMDCSTPCDLPWAYYCCVNPETEEATCELGYECPAGYTMVGGPYDESTCLANCSDTLGACCQPAVYPCSGSGDCEPITTYFAKDECGTCQEYTAGEEDYWSGKPCWTYTTPDCTGPISGWRTLEQCQNDGYVASDCLDMVPAYACLGTGNTWHPNLNCWQVNCPGNCYDNNVISQCQGSPGTPDNGNCYLPGNYTANAYSCANNVEVTVEISGVLSDAVCPVEEEGYSDPDICDDDPFLATARSMLEGMLNATFTLQKTTTGLLTCADPIEVCDDSGSVTVDGVVYQVITKAIVSLIAEDVSAGGYLPGSVECGKNACFRVRVDWVVCVHVAEDGYDCDSFTYCDGLPNYCGGVQSEKHCIIFAINDQYTKACDCYPKSYDCEGEITGMAFESMGAHASGLGCSAGCCLEDLFDGATASITFATAP